MPLFEFNVILCGNGYDCAVIEYTLFPPFFFPLPLLAYFLCVDFKYKKGNEIGKRDKTRFNVVQSFTAYIYGSQSP